MFVSGLACPLSQRPKKIRKPRFPCLRRHPIARISLRGLGLLFQCAGSIQAQISTLPCSENHALPVKFKMTDFNDWAQWLIDCRTDQRVRLLAQKGEEKKKKRKRKEMKRTAAPVR